MREPLPHAPVVRLAGRLALLFVAFALALAPVVPGAARSASAADAPLGPTARDFAGVIRAWSARDAAAIAAFLPAEGRIPVNLRGGGNVPRIRQSVTRANGAQVLKQYFEGVEGVRLKDLGSGRSRSDTRTFEYGYRPKGADAVASRLVLRLTPVAGGGFALAGIDEP